MPSLSPDDPRHGTTAGHSAHTDTPCDACRAAKARYEANRVRQKAYGRWEPYVDAEPARQHVRELMRGGMPIANIAKAAGVLTGRISTLLYPINERPPTRHIRPALANAILAVTLEVARPSALGVARRLQALVALGHSGPVLAARLGVTTSRVEQMLKTHTDKVMASTVDQVDALYRELCMTFPPETNKLERYAASRARGTARRHGWVPPLAWDDIDDPDEIPKATVDEEGADVIDPVVVDRLLHLERIKSTKAEKHAAMAQWLARGRSEKSLCDAHGWKYGRYLTKPSGAEAHTQSAHKRPDGNDGLETASAPEHNTRTEAA